VKERQHAYDRLVALGYRDRVPFLGMLSRDLAELPTCQERLEKLEQIKNLNDPAAIPFIERARSQPGNDCLTGAADAAINALRGDAGPAPSKRPGKKPARP
jgi:hypothetical protein